MKKYSALRTVATIMKILGIIYGVLTILGALATCLMFGFAESTVSDIFNNYNYGGGMGGAGIVAGIVLGLFVLITGGISALLMYGSGELIYLLIDVEQNTRDTADMLRIASQNP